MDTVASADGTMIAFDRYGDGSPVIMTVGAFNTRSQTGPLARALAPRFTALNYDRRGRGDSGDSAYSQQNHTSPDLPYKSTSIFKNNTKKSRQKQQRKMKSRMMMYETTFKRMRYPALPADFARELAELVSAGRRGDAVELYQTQAVGIPEEVAAQMRHAPFRPGMEAIAHTLAYDAAVIGDRSFPAGLLATVTVPALVITGEQSPPFLGNAAQAAAKTLPNGRLAVLPDQGHDLNPHATAPVMAEFLAS